jgi:hypothetical protein
MRGLLNLIACGVLAMVIGPTVWDKLPITDKNDLSLAARQFGHALHEIGAGSEAPDATSAGVIPAGDDVLMMPGLWSVTADMNMAGRPLSQSGNRCISSNEVQNILSSGGSGLIQFPNSNGCQMQQSLSGRVLTGVGQCSNGGMSLQMAMTVNFDTSDHLTARMSESLSGQPGPAVSAAIEGRRIGDCSP